MLTDAEFHKLIDDLRRAAATWLSDEIQQNLEKLISIALANRMKRAA
jgi:hypothetical protein